MQNILIFGYGWVGKAQYELFNNGRNNVMVIDPALSKPEYKDPTIFSTIDAIELLSIDCVFICVPTPELETGQCDTSIVEDTVKQLESGGYEGIVVIRSTVEVGTTHKLQRLYPSMGFVFQPEYLGETVAHPLMQMSKRPFLIFGADVKSIHDRVVKIHQEVYNADVDIHLVTTHEAELIKYAENCYLATKVTFCNELYDICNAIGADYNKVREGFTADPRVTKSHTFVYPEKRGWSGKCLPKDTAAICHTARSVGAPFEIVESVRKINEKHRES